MWLRPKHLVNMDSVDSTLPPRTRLAMFFRGMRRCGPIAVSAIPFGAAAGIAAADVGMSPLEASAMSLLIFAGASQLAVLELAKTGAPPVVMVLVAVTINLRFAMYSAALSTWAKSTRRSIRILLAYMLTDQAFAVTTNALLAGEVGSTSARTADSTATDAAAPPDEDMRDDTVVFYAGAAIALWVAWQFGTLAGAIAGLQAPEGLGIDFIAPLAFVALAGTAIRTRFDVVGATASVATFLLLSNLPYGLALIPAAIIGVSAREIARRALGVSA